MEELPAWLKNAADDAKMGGYTKAELMAMDELDRFAAVKDWITEDMKNTQTYLDSAGNKVGQSFDNSSIEKYVDDIIPDNRVSEMNSNDYIKHKYEQKASSNTEGTATGSQNGEDIHKNKEIDSETGETGTKKDTTDTGSDSGHQDTGTNTKSQDQTSDGTHKGDTDGGTDLSGGQKQRIAIARALLTNPKILIFDEATSALDYESESIIQNNLKQICKDRTVIIIAHRLSTLKDADAIMVVEKGSIAEYGTIENLIDKKGIYYHLLLQQQMNR